MNKMTRKITVAFVGIVCVAALILVLYNMLVQGKLTSSRDAATTSTEISKLLEKDLDDRYPDTPTEVVKLYWRLNKCMYNSSMSDKNFEGLLKQLRKLYDEELLAEEDNSWDQMLKNFKKDKNEYNKKKRTISNYTVQQNSTVQYGDLDGKEGATVITCTLMKEKSDRKQTYEKFICRKDEQGKWRILGWEQVTDEKEISVLGED